MFDSHLPHPYPEVLLQRGSMGAYFQHWRFYTDQYQRSVPGTADHTLLGYLTVSASIRHKQEAAVLKGMDAENAKHGEDGCRD